MVYDNNDGPIYSMLNGKTVGYLVSGDARVQDAPYAAQGQPLYPLLSGTYCDTGLTNSDGIPIYKLTLDSNYYNMQYLYLVRASAPGGPDGRFWFIKNGGSGNFSQGAVIYGDSNVLQAVNTGTPQSSPPSSGWNKFGYGIGSITSVTATTC